MIENNDTTKKLTKLSKWTNEPTYEDLYSDFSEANSSRQIQIEKILSYRENMEGGKPIHKSVRDRGKSTQRPLVIRKTAEWAYPIMEEPFLSTTNMFTVQPRGKDDEDKAKIASQWLNWVMNTKIDKTDFIAELVRTLYDEGTVLVKDGWYSRYDTVEEEYDAPVYASPEEGYMLLQQAVQSGELDQAKAEAMIQMGEPVQIGTEKKTRMVRKLVDNHPTLEVCDNTNIIVDPTCEGRLDRAKFIIHEYETDYATLKENEKIDGQGIYKNLDAIIIENKPDVEYSYEGMSTEEGTFYFKDKPRMKVKAYEYWGYWDVDGDGTLTSIVATWVGNTMIRMEENPFPHGELPFSVARYMPRKKEFWGEPDGKLLKENQDSIGIYTRAMHDQTITNSLGQTITDETLFSSPSQWQAYEKGLPARSRPGADPRKMIYKSKIEPIDKSIFDMMTIQREDAESLSGQKNFNDGVTGDALGSSVGGIRSATDAITKRKLSVLRRISDSLLRSMARHMLANAQEFLEEQTVLRLTDGEYVEVFKQDIQMEYDLKVEINTPEKEQEISNKIAFMMQTTAQTMPFEFQKAMYKRWARVNKLIDLEKDIDEMQPPGPSPEEQEMQKMQLEKMQLDLETARMENEKVRAEIAKLYSDRDRNDAHTYEAIHRMDLNSQKVANDTAKVRAAVSKLDSERDMIDAKYVQDMTGATRQQQVNDQEFKANIELAKEQAKHKVNNKDK